MTQWDEQVVMLNISYHCGGACACWNPEMFHSDLLSDIVEGVWHCDIPDGDEWV